MAKRRSSIDRVTLERTEQLWQRVRRRLRQSRLWQSAPAEVVAAEFLSLLRLAVAPVRLEGWILRRGDSDPLASTQPDVICPLPGLGDRLNGEETAFHFDTGDLIRLGPRAIDAWRDALEPTRHLRLKSTGRYYVDYFSSLSSTKPQRLSDAYTLHLYAGEKLGEEDLRNLLDRLPVSDLLEEERRQGQEADWRLATQTFLDFRNLRDHIFQDILDQMETDLALHVQAEPLDTWLLTLDEKSRSVRFLSPPRKLRRVLDHHAQIGNSTIGELRPDGDSGRYFDRLLIPCRTGLHSSLSWDDSTRLSLGHLECIAEKFWGWPKDRGIVGTLIGTGCLEVVENFTSDYRVKAYGYLDDEVQPIPGDSDDFHAVRLAERIFIRIRPHLVEIPLLWYPHEDGSQCWGVLLALFQARGKKAFAQRALQIRSVVEQWYLTFELQSRLLDRARVTAGNIIHETRGAFEEVKKKLPERSSDLSKRLDVLWAAYSYLQDDRIPQAEPLSLAELGDTVRKAAKSALGREGSAISLDLDESQVPEQMAAPCRLNVVPEMALFALRSLISESALQLRELSANRALADHDSVIEMSFRSSPDQNRLILIIRHRITQGAARFLREHRDSLGRMPIVSTCEGKRRSHLGLFYVGNALRSFQADLLEPELDADDATVTWRISFALGRN